MPIQRRPSTSYNGIAVGVDDGPTTAGPTEDNGRSKPDITAPGDYSSFSTASVSGSAGNSRSGWAGRIWGEFGANRSRRRRSPDDQGIVAQRSGKQAVRFDRTPTAPLDPLNGAGQLNVHNSFEQLAGGFHAASSVANTASVGGAHPADTTSAPISSLAGWNFASLSSTAASDAYANYVFSPPTGVAGYTFTATLVWERQYNLNPAIPLGINNLDLYLYDTTKNQLVDYSISKVDNVQDVFDQNLTAGDRYDLEVLKTGGIAGVTPGVVSNSETYALAYNIAAAQTAAGVWDNSSGGNVSAAGNWSGAVPQYATDTANFTGAITSAATVTVGSNWTLGNINFDNSHSYTIAGDGWHGDAG